MATSLTSLLESPGADSVLRARALRTVVVATDGSEEGDAALALAQEFASEAAVDVHVVSVCEPQPVADFSQLGVMMPTVPALDPAACRNQRLLSVHAQLARTVGTKAGWPLTVRTGNIGSCIAGFAADRKADLIITGRGRHGVVDRLFGEEHLLKLLRATDIPVLAAEPTLTIAPTRAVVAIDFSTRSLELMRTTLMLLGDESVMYLVHVKPDPPFGVPHPGQWLSSYEDGVRVALDGLRARVRPSATMTVETIVLNGSPGTAIVDFARGANADLIATGSHGHGFFSRLVIGSVTARLLRTAPCSLLSV